MLVSVNGCAESRCSLTSIFRKLGLIGAVFFIANSLAAITSLVILFTRRGHQAQLVGGRTCPVCNTALASTAKYCQECGSRT